MGVEVVGRDFRKIAFFGYVVFGKFQISPKPRGGRVKRLGVPKEDKKTKLLSWGIFRKVPGCDFMVL